MERRRLWWVLAFVLAGSNIVATTNLGCLFSEGLCKLDAEWCYDDGAFGRCLPTHDVATEEDLYRHKLGEDDLGVLEEEMEKLMGQGFRWTHDYTQCVLQALLFAFKTGTQYDSIICDKVKDQDLEAALKAMEQDNEFQEEADPKSVAYIQYTPSARNPHADYADEVYYPPNPRPLKPLGVQLENPDFAVVRRSPPRSHFSTQYNTPEGFRLGHETRDQGPVFLTDSVDVDPLGLTQTKSQLEKKNQVNTLKETKTQDNARLPYTERVGNVEEGGVSETLNSLANEILEAKSEEELRADPGRAYTEGGPVFIPNKSLQNSIISTFLDELGFKRNERLDVKKPGPPFNSNNQQAGSTSKEEPHKKDISKPSDDPNPDSDQYDVVDTTFAYIEFRDSLKTWKEGSLIISTVAKLLNVSRSIFTHERVDRNEVTFKVQEPNSFGINASEVARQIDYIKDGLRKAIGVVVTAAGIGDQTKVPVKVKMSGDGDMYVAIVLVCGVLAALVLSAIVLVMTRRHSSAKMQGLTSVDTEPSKHYQELCRARMSGKNQTETTSAAAPPQRVTSLSRESDNSPSSRSSTSSWSEEPALSNMDISTGHMVLAYMEDHLKNKDRLESEWTALCAYEADPCATTIAQRPENEKKNRYPGALPYDHARVVLNELSNLTGSDYINASTITDHDPRNPAYIVTQGPLPHTAPDFWQMVWEQGCVVLVMLTRLAENDVTMCHRYWPEEGSELYHIYEVHLVSEHIWCDDYLVRSFYLKNLKTGETRTVTQFHFLSWPDGGVPSSTKALLEFRRKVNKSFRGRSCPIVVHCNDGIGRSGTYCLLDMVLNRMAKGAKEIDIAATLEHIRDQRAGAVATKQQFQLVLAAVAEEVQAILKSQPQP